jgi:hypothetical protein
MKNGQLAAPTTNFGGETPRPARRRNGTLPIDQQLLL